MLFICVSGIDFCCIYVLGVYNSIVYMCLGYRFLLYICVSGIDLCCIYMLGVYISVVYMC